MDNAHARLHRPRHAAGIGISLAVHALLLAMWHMSRPTRVPDDTAQGAMVVRLLQAPAAAPADAPAPAPQRLPAPPVRKMAPPPTPRAATPDVPKETSARLAATVADTPASAQAAAEPAPAVASEAPAPPAPGSMLERARAAAGGIDRGLRKENPTRGIVAPVVTPQMKLRQGIARANELAPNKWYEAPKVEAVLDPGGYDRRRYRVVGAAGTYCVTYESNHAPDGLDTMRDGIKPKKTTCDPDWAPPTIQKWN